MALAEALDLPQVPNRIECFDISHTAGEGTVASCVVFGPEGALKKEYRRFNIAGITPGDDYAALHQALQRRYTKIRDGEQQGPDLLLIDGGAGQIEAVHSALAELGITGLALVGVAKGPDRRPGQERLFVYGEALPRTLPPESPARLTPMPRLSEWILIALLDLDLRLTRQFSLGEHRKMELFFEGYNVTNHVTPTGGATAMTSAALFVRTGALDPRQLQWGTRFTF